MRRADRAAARAHPRPRARPGSARDRSRSRRAGGSARVESADPPSPDPRRAPRLRLCPQPRNPEEVTMPGKFCVSLTHAKDNPDKATVAFVVANAAAGSDQETMVFLSTEGVHLAIQGA